MSIHYDDPFELPHGTNAFAREIAGQICWLPHRLTVQGFGKEPVFWDVEPEDIRKLTSFAFLWTQDEASIPNSWEVVHVFGPSGYPGLHLGNLVLIQSWAASLAKPGGPLSPYLQYHAKTNYNLGIMEDSEEAPEAYDEISWNYIRNELNPKAKVLKHIQRTGRSGRSPHAMLMANIEHWHSK